MVGVAYKPWPEPRSCWLLVGCWFSWAMDWESCRWTG